MTSSGSKRQAQIRRSGEGNCRGGGLENPARMKRAFERELGLVHAIVVCSLPENEKEAVGGT